MARMIRDGSANIHEYPAQSDAVKRVLLFAAYNAHVEGNAEIDLVDLLHGICRERKDWDQLICPVLKVIKNTGAAIVTKKEEHEFDQVRDELLWALHAVKAASDLIDAQLNGSNRAALVKSWFESLAMITEYDDIEKYIDRVESELYPPTIES